jgi:hypothetical protein
VHAQLHGGDRRPEHLGSLGDRQPVALDELERGPVHLGHALELLPDP